MNHCSTRSVLTALALGSLLVGGLGCGEESSKSKTPEPSEMVEYDLSPAGEQWKGWTANGPKTCKVMGDLGGAARLACDGPDIVERTRTGHSGFDILFKPGAVDLAELKEQRKEQWDQKAAAGEHTILVDEPGFLAWRQSTGKFHSFQFMLHLKVGGKDVTCTPLNGAGIEAEHELHLAACRTLAKK